MAIYYSTTRRHGGLVVPIPRPAPPPDAPIVIGAHVGQIAGAIGHDPDGIVVSAVDIAGGGVRVEVDLAGDTDIESAAMWSIPLRDVAGQVLGPQPPEMPGRLGFDGELRLDILSDWTDPSGVGIVWVGVTDAPFGSAEYGLVYGVQREAGDERRLVSWRAGGSGWAGFLSGNDADVDITGLVGGLGSPNGSGGHSSYAAQRASPIGVPPLARNRASGTASLGIQAGKIPHLVFGVSGDGVVGSVDFLARAAVINTGSLLGDP